MIEEKLKILEKGIESAQKFLENICSPASEELGLMLRDKVRQWRLNNIIKILNKSSGNFDFENDQLILKAHPRIVSEIMEKGSWQDNEEIQSLWAGLLTSSLDSSGRNDENIIFINILNKLTVRQVRIIKYFAEKSPKKIDSQSQLTTESGIILDSDIFFRIVECQDIDILSSEIKHLNSLGLVESGFGLACGFFEETKKDPASHAAIKTGRYCVGLKLSSLALRLYIKGQGFKGKMNDFFDDLK